MPELASNVQDGTSKIRNAELCKVVDLQYVIGEDDCSNTYVRTKLEIQALDSEESPLQGQTFTVDLPPSHLGQADFLVPKGRFGASKQHSFCIGEACQVNS